MTQKVVVYYTGVNAKRKSGKHTKKEFLTIMKKTYLSTDFYYTLWGSSHDPIKLRKFTFRQWVKWSGAIVENHS